MSFTFSPHSLFDKGALFEGFNFLLLNSPLYSVLFTLTNESRQKKRRQTNSLLAPDPHTTFVVAAAYRRVAGPPFTGRKRTRRQNVC